MQRIPFGKLGTADLYVDAVYESNGAPNLSGDVLSMLMNVGTMSGFRKVNVSNKTQKIVSDFDRRLKKLTSNTQKNK